MKSEIRKEIISEVLRIRKALLNADYSAEEPQKIEDALSSITDQEPVKIDVEQAVEDWAKSKETDAGSSTASPKLTEAGIEIWIKNKQKL